MFTPANFYLNSNCCSYNLAFGLTKSTDSIPLKEATSLKVGSIWSEIFNLYGPNVAKILDQDTIIGTGQWIKSDLFITCAHIIPFKRGFITAVSLYKQSFKLDVKKAEVDKENDYFIFKISNPNFQAYYPKISTDQNFTHQYGMIHFASSSNQPLVSVGHIDSDPHFNYNPTIDIDGGPGSSGAMLFNEKGEIAFLHISKHINFEKLRFNFPLNKIPSLFPESLKNNSSSDVISLSMEILEHGRFTSSFEVKSDRLKFTKKIFSEAKKFIYEILENQKEKFYSQLFTSVGTISRGSLPSLRLDVQSHAKNYANIQIQYDEWSIAGVLVSHAFKTCEAQDIPFICKYVLGKLINCISEAEKSKQLVMAQIDLRKTFL